MKKLDHTSFEVRMARIEIYDNNKLLLVPSMVLSTLWVCILITLIPWAVPVMMVDATGGDRT